MLRSSSPLGRILVVVDCETLFTPWLWLAKLGICESLIGRCKWL